MNGDLISRSALLDLFDGNEFLLESIVRHCIEKAPAVDAVEVVRCRDCAHRGNDAELDVYTRTAEGGLIDG